ncbi:MAG: hypothetical protein Q4E26_02685 [Prevotellaceae bacterium]|nr:hypothetical protein [Prevotellaceae bacterium]
MLLKETIIDFIKLYLCIKLNIHCQSMEQLMTMFDKVEIDLALSYRTTKPIFDT